MKTRSKTVLKHTVGTGVSEGDDSVAPSTVAKAWCDSNAMVDILAGRIPYLLHLEKSGVKSSKLAKFGDTEDDDAGTTLLIIACSIGSTRAVQDLLRLGADRSLSGKECFVEGELDRNETFPLEVACINHETAIVQLLLAAGEDVNRGGLYGRTALHAAALLGHEELTHVLLSHPEIEVGNSFSLFCSLPSSAGFISVASKETALLTFSAPCCAHVTLRLCGTVCVLRCM